MLFVREPAKRVSVLRWPKAAPETAWAGGAAGVCEERGKGQASWQQIKSDCINCIVKL